MGRSRSIWAGAVALATLLTAASPAGASPPAHTFVVDSAYASLGIDFFGSPDPSEDDADLSDDVCRTPSGSCTLRAAVEQSNASAGRDRIAFDLPSGGTTIALLRNVPAIADGVDVDGTTQSGYAGDPVVRIVQGSGCQQFLGGGQLCASSTTGFTVQAAGTTIEGLAFDGGGWAGITAHDIASPAGVVLSDNWFGLA